MARVPGLRNLVVPMREGAGRLRSRGALPQESNCRRSKLDATRWVWIRSRARPCSRTGTLCCRPGTPLVDAFAAVACSTLPMSRLRLASDAHRSPFKTGRSVPAALATPRITFPGAIHRPRTPATRTGSGKAAHPGHGGVHRGGSRLRGGRFVRSGAPGAAPWPASPGDDVPCDAHARRGRSPSRWVFRARLQDGGAARGRRTPRSRPLAP